MSACARCLARASSLASAAGSASSFTPRAIRAEAARLGLTSICVHCDDDFPVALADEPTSCDELFVCGRRELLGRLRDEAAVAVVGSRKASPYGLEVARSLGYELAATGITVVSGMAYGVDAAAHRGALEAGGFTVAVLACGAEYAYPRRHRDLHAEIAAAGLVLSEFPPGFRPRRWCFPARNRIMAALARMTIVVEGSFDSGSLITARFAQDLGRDVGAVPGPITSRTADGPNNLIADGACVIRGTQDALDAIYGVGCRTVVGARARTIETLDQHARQLLEGVEQGEGSPELLADRVGSAARALAGLSELELLGLVRRDASGSFVACLPAAGAYAPRS